MGNWTNQDNLYLKFGTTKITAEQAGDFVAYGTLRILEVDIPSATFTTLAAFSSGLAGTILSDTVFFPPAGSTSSGAGAASSNTWVIEKVELFGEVSAVPFSSGSPGLLNVGLVQFDRATVPSGYQAALLSGVSAAQMSSGAFSTFVATGSLPTSATGAGTFVGGTPSAATGPYYLTASTTTSTFTAGAARVRVYYRGTGTITQ
jgi:hypothetical protein